MSYCKQCPNWSGTGNKSIEGYEDGHCRADLPKAELNIVTGQIHTFFPIMAENEWCMPGRAEMQARAQAMQPAPPTQGKVYDEL
jgi:hypothetical protein